MKLLTGEVVNGKVVMHGAPVARGTPIAVYIEDELDDVDLDVDMQAELTNAAAEIARGEFVTPEDLFETFRRSSGEAPPR